MSHTLPLFDQVPAPQAMRTAASPIDERRRAMNAAFEHADERWRTEYEAFILRFLTNRGPATAERIRTAYERTSLPQTRKSKRASGAIFVALRRAGKIREAGRETSRLYGNGLVRYEVTNNGEY